MKTEFLNNIVLGNSIRNYLLFIGILLFGLLFKRIFSRFLSKLLYRMFRSVHAGTDSNVFIGLLLKPVELLILLSTLYLAINQLDYPLNEVIFRRTDISGKPAAVYEIRLIQAIDKVFLLLFIISFFRILLRIIDFIAHIFLYKASLTESKSDNQMVPFAKELSKIITIIFAVFVVLGSVFNLNVATIIAGLGIGGIAVALAAQDTLQNLLGSFTIFADKPFVVGDLVKIDKYEGTIEKVGFRSTLLRTTDKTLVVIPNKKMVDSPLENLTLRNFHRIKFNIGLKYDTPIEVMEKIAAEIKKFIASQSLITDETIVTFDTLGDSALNIQVQYFIKVAEGADYAQIKEDINYRIIKIVADNGARFALPPQFAYTGFPAESAGKKPEDLAN
ncbi:MAG: mechanosensitive ion channel family protein [Daejeonella sp.]|uniref:mechanosensitive ion channel family protein n=1 Tax=Daejeonella sp. JGW-45 TaxID=3034148 RepID=UPI0023EDC8BF|nr:mechanosensitive ion channel family protein [Daejeonella sp. JGW-45]